jgi:hypothetical protein
MNDFMKENPEFVLKILESQGFNKEKLEKILNVYNHPSFEFTLESSCPDGLLLQTELKERIYHVDNFQRYLKEKNFNYENMRAIGQSYPEDSYRVIMDLGTSNEFRIYFYPPSKE